MNCNCSTKTSTASLYRNGQLITQASANFIVCNRENPDNDINLLLGYNRCGNALRICSFIRNNSVFISNAILRVKVCCVNNCCYNSCKCREFYLCGLGSGATRQVCFNLNRCCCSCYYIEAQVIVNNEIVARECLTV